MVDQIAAIIAALHGIQLVSYADGAAMTIYIYDYLLTFDMEIELVWKSKWNWVKFLYLVQRYMPFFDTAFLTLYAKWGANLSPSGCGRLSYVIGFMYLIGMLFSEAILTIRVWALWNRDRRMLIFLPIAFVMVMTPCFIAIYYFSKYLVYASAPYPGFKGCFAVGARHYAVWCWVFLLLWNTGTLALMLVPGINSYRSGRLGVRSNLNDIVYRDGILYYIYLFVFSIVNIATSVTQPPSTRSLTTSLERCLHSMFASRVLLHMRDHGKRPIDDGSSRLQYTSKEEVVFSDTINMNKGRPQSTVL